MSTEAEATTTAKPSGRPRTKKAEGLVRRNVLINPRDLERLRALLKATSDSETIREAVDSMLFAYDVEDAAERIRAFGGPDDVYGRTSGLPRLPALAKPREAPPEDRIRIEDDDAPATR